MTDITERLRRLYVQDGTNYVTEAADTIDNLRAKQARADQYHAAELADITSERNKLVNDVHSCHAGCTKAGCVAAGLQARVAHLEQLVTDAVYTLSTARFWDGQKWSYHSLHPIKYTQMRDRLAAEADAIYAAGGTK
jgi:hypothetical protein